MKDKIPNFKEFLELNEFQRSSKRPKVDKQQKVEELLLSTIHELQRELKPSIWRK